MEAHLICTENLSSKFSHHLTIHCHHACLNEFISLTTATYTCISQELVETKRFVGIVVNLLVLNTFLQTILGIRVIIGRMLTGIFLIRGVRLVGLIGIIRVIAALTRLITATRLITTTRLESTLLIHSAITGLTGLVTTTGLTYIVWTTTVIASLTWLVAIFSRLVTTFTRLTGLITAIIVIATSTWTITRTLRCAALQTCAKAFWTEAAFILIMIVVTRTLIGWTLSIVNTGARRTTRAEFTLFSLKTIFWCFFLFLFVLEIHFFLIKI